MNDTATAAVKTSSHEYARNLQKLGEWLLSRPEFEIGRYSAIPFSIFNYWDKDQFLAAARALGTGKKQFTEREVQFEVVLPFGEIRCDAPRDKVCRLIRPAEYECDPFLTDAELAQIGGAQ